MFNFMERSVFLTLEGWRHSNPAIQALVAPAQAWEHVGVDEIRPSLLLEVKHMNGGELTGIEWILSSSVETLVDFLANAPDRVGVVHVLVPGGMHASGCWSLEKLAKVEEWTLGDRSGFECHTEVRGARYSFPHRPQASCTRREWYVR